jgi:caa(3)-type oxidase subunit IV
MTRAPQAGPDAATPLRAELRTLARVWVALMLLAALTIGLALVPMGVGNPLAAVAIALAKGALVLVCFMQLRAPVLRAVCVVAVMMLCILVGLSAVDYLGREPPTQPAAPSRIDRLPQPLMRTTPTLAIARQRIFRPAHRVVGQRAEGLQRTAVVQQHLQAASQLLRLRRHARPQGLYSVHVVGGARAIACGEGFQQAGHDRAQCKAGRAAASNPIERGYSSGSVPASVAALVAADSTRSTR